MSQGPPVLGTELAYAENTSHVQGLAAAGADVTGLSINFTVGNRPVVVEVFLPLVGQVTSTGQPTFYIGDGTNLKARSQAPSIAAGGFYGGVIIKERIPANAGAVNRRVRVGSTAGTVSVFAQSTTSDTYRPYIQAIQV